MTTIYKLYEFLESYEKSTEQLIIFIQNLKCRSLILSFVRIILDKKWKSQIKSKTKQMTNNHEFCNCIEKWKNLICEDFIKYIGKCDKEYNAVKFDRRMLEWNDDHDTTIQCKEIENVIRNVKILNDDDSIQLNRIFQILPDQILSMLSPSFVYAIFNLSSKITLNLLTKTLPETYRPVRDESLIESLTDSLYSFHIDRHINMYGNKLLTFYKLTNIITKPIQFFKNFMMNTCVAQIGISGVRLCICKLEDGQIYTFNVHGVSVNFINKVKTYKLPTCYFCAEFILTNDNLILLDLFNFNGNCLIVSDYVKRLDFAKNHFESVIENLTREDLLFRIKNEKATIFKYKYAGLVENYILLKSDKTYYKFINKYTGSESIVNVECSLVVPNYINFYKISNFKKITLLCYASLDSVLKFAIRHSTLFIHFLTVDVKSINGKLIERFCGSLNVKVDGQMYLKCFVCKIYFYETDKIFKIRPTENLTLLDCNTL